MYKREKMAAAFWIIIFAILVGLTGGVNEKCRSFPYFVCAIGIVFSALQFANVCFKEKKNIPIDDPIPSMSREQLGTVALALFFSFAYIGLIRILGYFVTTFIFIAGFSYWQNKNQKKSWYILVPVIMIVIVFLAFKLMLNVPLPSGLLI